MVSVRTNNKSRSRDDAIKMFSSGCTCVYCKEPILEIDVVKSYDGWVWRPVHQECKPLQQRVEAYDVQCIDADCNDCRHFKRGDRLNPKSTQGFNGICNKDGSSVKAYVRFASGHNCFEHRLGV